MHIQGNLMIQTQENNKKLHFGRWAQIRATFFFFFFFFPKIWLYQSIDIVIDYHHVKISEKTNDPILRKLSDGRKDRRADGQTDRQTDS